MEPTEIYLARVAYNAYVGAYLAMAATMPKHEQVPNFLPFDKLPVPISAGWVAAAKAVVDA